MKSISAIAASLLLLTLIGGCRNQPAASTQSETQATAASAQSTLTPEQLGELGAQIKKSPNDAQRLITERGLTEQSFETAVRRVAEDPAASKRYAAAYHKAGA